MSNNWEFFKNLKACDVRELVSCNGRATLHGQKCEFRSNSVNDPLLCSILQDNNCTIKMVGQPTHDNCCTYEVCCNDKHCQIQIACC